ncbi:glutamate--cysteine ligase [Dactylosporangium sp. NPDC049140]|uniref:carboxylate-amine ligase n=1 Tax=Dactylosporangium sp. NPDC049140 TaxID=3155647 RepID=UPI0033EFC028
MPLTVGVEEEFLLLDPESWHSLPLVERVRAALPAELRPASRHEFRLSILEMVTPVCTDLGELRGHLAANRRAAAEATRRTGVRLVAVGATPVAEPDRTVAHSPRYRAIARHYGPIARDPALCGAHVHVGVPDRDLAVRVCTALRPWLPLLQAVTANSPFAGGEDTGHDSWRGIAGERWPGIGPTPPLDSFADYERTVAELVASGSMFEPELVWWYARPSLLYPTVEVRVADACPTSDDTVLLAALVRGLVATLSAEVRAEKAAPAVPEHLLRAAHWNACHTGLAGTLTDPLRRTARLAGDMIAELFTAIAPALAAHGDLELVQAGLLRLRDEGNGATRLRRAARSSGGLPGALHARAEETAAA